MYVKRSSPSNRLDHNYLLYSVSIYILYSIAVSETLIESHRKLFECLALPSLKQLGGGQVI